MMPRILEYDDNQKIRVRVTAAAFALPEIKAILDKYELKAEPYLAYIHAMASPESPYINVPAEEREDAVIYDIQATLGEFDNEEPLLKTAVESLKKKYETPLMSLANEIGEELNRWKKILSTEAVKMGGDGNFKDRNMIVAKIGQIATEYNKLKKLAQEEMNVATKGDHELGDY